MATTEEVLATGWRSPDIIRLMLYDYMKQLLADGHRLRVTRPTPGRVLEVSNTAMTFR